MRGAQTINLSLRETRLLLERIFQHLGVEDCLLHSVKDAAMYSVALKISDFGGLFDHFDAVSDFAPHRMRLVDGEAIDTLDAGGQHAWIVAEPALALLVSSHRHRTGSAVVVRNATAPRELGVIAGLAEKFGIVAEISNHADGSVEIRARTADPIKPKILAFIQREGLSTTYGLWERLLDLSKKALAPDSPLSRTHNGDIIVRPDGKIIGRRDEEFSDMDPKLLVEEINNLQSSDEPDTKKVAVGKS